MRRTVLMSALALALAAPAFAGPKDQAKETMVAPQSLAGNAMVTNATTTFVSQTKGCSLQIKAKGITGLTDGDIVICLAAADVISPPYGPNPVGRSVLLLGEVKSGGVSVRADLSEIGCGTDEQVSFNSDLKCYVDDANYRSDPSSLWKLLCLGQSMSWSVNASLEPKKLKVNDTENVIVGQCRGSFPGARLPGPVGGTVIAQRGLRTAVAQ